MTEIHGLTAERERQRATVASLLERASDSKLLARGTAEAERHLRTASRLAGEVLSPLPELVSYRLALILLRAGRAANLREVDSLLKHASTCRALGPYPLLYRLAILHRLGVNPGAMESAFAEARNRVLAEEESQQDISALQDATFNMLELAGCFLGLTLSDLEGQGRLHARREFGRYAIWTIVGDDRELKPVRYSRELAVAELDARSRADGRAILFKAPEGPMATQQTEYRLDRERGWQKARGETPWKLVALVLSRRRISRLELEREFHTPAGFRQALSRARKWFRLEVGLDPITESDSEFRINSEVRIYGVTPVSQARR